MSKGTVHTNASLILAGAFAVTLEPEMVAGAIVGVFISPDLDVDAGSIADYYIRRLGWFGRLLENAWDLFWLPYRKSLKHGSPLSHFPPLGTMGRVGYVFTLCILLPYAVFALLLPGAWDTQAEVFWWLNLMWQHPRFFIGLTSADAIHYALDITTTDSKKKK